MLAQEENAGFEDLDGLLKKFNQKLKETPISGECNEGGGTIRELRQGEIMGLFF